MINKSKIQKIQLSRDLTRKINQGNPWVFDDAITDIPDVEPGTMAKLVDKKNKFVAFGYIYPESQLCFRVLVLKDRVPNADLIKERIQAAYSIRQGVISEQTNSFRLLNGEGDLLPGLVVDVFAKVAVLQLDGPGPMGFYDRKAIGEYIYELLDLECVYFKARHNSGQENELLVGELKSEQVEFLEYGAKFSCDVAKGQKTGFFLDQRENRNLIRKFSKDLKVLNMFSYTGGFSVNAGVGGASEVTSVDISKPASKNAELNWELNDLPDVHDSVCENCFDFIDTSMKEERKWDMVIVDPPSFAPSKKTLDKAINSYTKIFTESLRLCEREGYFAASSCSSHITQEMFLEICQASISKARRRARIVFIGGQGCDHPYPLALTEMRYLKFVLFRVY
jgi:23S rRNA (cytosine1962-C5)-methyltransferase